MDTVSTGLDFLDREIQGFRRGKPYLVFGVSGAGKSAFGIQYALAGLERGETILYVYHGRGEELLELASYLGFDLESYLASENLILIEVDDEVRKLVQKRGPEVALDALRQQIDDTRIQRVVFDPVDVFFSELHNETLLRTDLWSVTNRLEPLGWTPLMLWNNDTSAQPTALRVFSEECYGLFELRPTIQADMVDSDPGIGSHTLLVYKIRDAHLSRRRFHFNIGKGGLLCTDPDEESSNTGHPFTRFRTDGPPRRRATDHPEAAPSSKPIKAAVDEQIDKVFESEVDPNADTQPELFKSGTPGIAPPKEEDSAQVSSGASSKSSSEAAFDPDCAYLPKKMKPGRGKPVRVIALGDAPAPEKSKKATTPILDDPDEETSPTLASPPKKAKKAKAKAKKSKKEVTAPILEPLSGLPDRRAVVLIVDDDALAREMASDALKNECDILQAANAADGLEFVLEKHPDIILLDVVMPGPSGPELCGTLRELGVNVPVIFLSAKLDQPRVQNRCLELGGNDTLPKPFEPKKLRAKVRRHLTESLLESSPEWPDVNVEDAKHALGQKEVGLIALEARLSSALEKAQTSACPISLLGYEFRFVTGNEGHAFVEHFVNVLSKAVGQNDDLCRVSDRRLVVVLYDADQKLARSIVQRAHRKMKSAATLLVGRATVKPKALFRLLHMSPEKLTNEKPTVQELVRNLFKQPAHLIEEEGDKRPGEPMEKYPLLEAVYLALQSDAKRCTSPLNGAQYFVDTMRPSGVRKVEIGEYIYRTQDPAEPSDEGQRARDGAAIVWVNHKINQNRVMARIEDERVFRDDH